MIDREHAQRLIVQALQCRELAALSENRMLRVHLLDMADEHEAALANLLGGPHSERAAPMERNPGLR